MLSDMYLKSFFFHDLSRWQDNLLLDLQRISALMSFFWIAALLAIVFLIFSTRKIRIEKKILIDAIICIGIVLSIAFLISGFSTVVNIYYSPKEAIHFRHAMLGSVLDFIFIRTSHLSLFLSLCFYERFSLLPYIENKRREKEKMETAV